MLSTTTLVVDQKYEMSVHAHALNVGGHSVSFSFGNEDGDSVEFAIIMNGDDSRNALVAMLTDALTKVVNTL